MTDIEEYNDNVFYKTQAEEEDNFHTTHNHYVEPSLTSESFNRANSVRQANPDINPYYPTSYANYTYPVHTSHSHHHNHQPTPRKPVILQDELSDDEPEVYVKKSSIKKRATFNETAFRKPVRLDLESNKNLSSFRHTPAPPPRVHSVLSHHPTSSSAPLVQTQFVPVPYPVIYPSQNMGMMYPNMMMPQQQPLVYPSPIQHQVIQTPAIVESIPVYQQPVMSQPMIQQPSPIYNIHYTPPTKPKIIETNYEIVRRKIPKKYY